MAGIYTPGPIHHFVQFRGAAQPVYLGTAVAAPKQANEKFKLEVFNDLSGRSVPFQLIQDGEKWMVTTVLNRFNLQVLRAIRALESGGAGLGFESATARGTLVLGVSDFSLILVNQYAGTAAQGYQATAGTQVLDLNNSRAFATSNLRTYEENTAGTRVLEVGLAVECLSLFAPANTLGFVTYSEGPAAVSPLLQLFN